MNSGQLNARLRSFEYGSRWRQRSSPNHFREGFPLNQKISPCTHNFQFDQWIWRKLTFPLHSNETPSFSFFPSKSHFRFRRRRISRQNENRFYVDVHRCFCNESTTFRLLMISRRVRSIHSSRRHQIHRRPEIATRHFPTRGCTESGWRQCK
jgi:hypothetical protein